MRSEVARMDLCGRGPITWSDGLRFGPSLSLSSSNPLLEIACTGSMEEERLTKELVGPEPMTNTVRLMIQDSGDRRGS